MSLAESRLESPNCGYACVQSCCNYVFIVIRDVGHVLAVVVVVLDAIVVVAFVLTVF